ncbi:MAG TPA: transposase [Tepidisphaeraceae bacterium]|nr:transposase [Tepidisphaeraceae bacterium]
MVRWYHAIFTAYGFWLPNDPRGSRSTFIASWNLLRFGNATTTSERRSVAHRPHDRADRFAAKETLRYPPVRFDSHQRELIATGIARACEESAIIVHACAIGWDHVHAVIGRHEHSVERVVGHLKTRATQALLAAAQHPFARYHAPPLPSPWARKCWSVFIDDESQLGAAIQYVRAHPMKEGLPAQHWDFVTPYR